MVIMKRGVKLRLAVAKRTNKDPRTLGTLFHACCEELQQATFAEALALVLMFLEHGDSGEIGRLFRSKSATCSG